MEATATGIWKLRKCRASFVSWTKCRVICSKATVYTSLNSRTCGTTSTQVARGDEQLAGDAQCGTKLGGEAQTDADLARQFSRTLCSQR